jgi:Ca2+-binding RTX toxin-like protein
VKFLKLNGPTSRTVALRVTDDQGATSIVVTTVDVQNAPPVATVSGPSFVLRRSAATFTGSFTDAAGSMDTHQVKWDFGDGTSTVFKAGESPSTMQHVYAKKGTYTVTFTVKDSDGACSSATTKIEVQVGHVFADTATGTSTLMVSGTDGADNLTVKRSSKTGKLELLSGSTGEGTFQADRVIIYGSAGNDVIRIDSSVTQPVEVFGGDGNDQIYGGKSDATLHGDAGNDHVVGGMGRNVLDGGAGNDVLEVPSTDKYAATLLGGAGNDVLRGGAGNDLLEGGDGNDDLDGRGGVNVLHGGSGKDHYTKKSKDTVFDSDDVKKTRR